jgi:hypothetical protein
LRAYFLRVSFWIAFVTAPTTSRPEAKSTLESDSKSSQRDDRALIARWLLGATVSVAIALCAAEIISRFIVFNGKPADSNDSQFDTKYRVANSLQASDANIVLCGDSLMKEGVYPELITASLKKSFPSVRASNLAVTGGTQLDAIKYLEYLKQRKVKPRLVVFDFEVSNTCLPTMANNIDWGQTRSYLFRGMLSRPSSLKETAQLLPSDIFYLVRQRANIKRSLCEFFNALPSQKIFARKSFFDLNNSPQLEVSESGMAPNNKITSSIDWKAEKQKIGFFTAYCPQSAAYKYNPEAYSLIIDYCRTNQLPLLMVWLPHQTKVYDALYYKAPFDESWHKEQFENYAKLPSVFAEYLNVLPDEPIYFHDYRHLNTYGCVKTSELLAQALQKPQYKTLLEASK